MQSKRFDQAKPFAVLGLVVVAWLIVPVVIKTFLRASFFEFQAPVSVAASYARDLQEYWTLRLHSKDELIAAGRDLGRLTSSSSISLQQNADVMQKLDRLEALLELPAFGEFRAEHARVVRREFSGWWQQLVIRKGRNHGIPVGAPVIFTGGVVGRISEVHAYTAIVELLSNQNVRLAAFVEGDTRPFTYQGGINTSFAAPKGVIEFVPVDIHATPNEPKRLVTSGLGGVFPPGLTLGKIIKVETSTDGLFKTGEVQLDPRLTALTEVTVLVPLSQE